MSDEEKTIGALEKPKRISRRFCVLEASLPRRLAEADAFSVSAAWYDDLPGAANDFHGTTAAYLRWRFLLWLCVVRVNCTPTTGTDFFPGADISSSVQIFNGRARK